MGEKCQECEQVLTPENMIVVTEDFKVCRSCKEETEAEWELMKKALVEQGINPHDCGWRERYL